MKIVALFGTDTDRVQTRMLDILKGVKKKGFRVSEIALKTSFAEALRSTSLFEENVLFVSDTASKRIETDWQWIEKNAGQQSASLLLLFGDTVPVKIKKYLPKDTKCEEFKIPVIIFQFLDSLVPGNKNALTLLKKVTDTEPIELVFSMMVTHLRDMYWVLSDSSSYAGPDWKKGRLLSQAKKIGLTNLKDAFSQLAHIDLDVKSSIGSLTIFVDNFLISFLVLK
jgi:DNA polymerase III delta subunit